MKHQADRPRYPCEMCGADFCSTDAVRKHVARMHTDRNIMYKCAMCPYHTKMPHDLKKHMANVHEKRWVGLYLIAGYCCMHSIKPYFSTHRL